MRGIWTKYQEQNITLNNLGIIKTNEGGYIDTIVKKAAHFALESDKANLIIQNYAIVISESQNEFNNFSGYDNKKDNKNSHLIITYNNYTPTAKNLYFKDDNSKIILDFGSEFELGKTYKIDKLVVSPNDGNPISALNVDFSRLTTRTSLYKLTQSGDNFIASLDAPNSEIGILHKSNIRTMNNFYTMSNAMIYPHKYSAKRTTKKKRVIRRVKKTASAFRHYEPSQESEESKNLNNALDSSLILLLKNDRFFYKSDSTNRNNTTTRRRIKTTNQTNRQATSTSQSIPSTLSNQNNYYFILTPFINHNLFFESGRYNLSGFDYGFLTTFSGKIAPNNSLGTHFIMSYGSLGDSKDKDFMIKSLNLNLGLNYKLDLIWDMYLKARGDFYYFLNQAKTLTMIDAIKPNNLGFGASVAFGKDFDFKSGGMLGIEAGLDYKALQSSTISLHDNVYQKSLYHLLYADLGVSYAKYFGNFGLNAGLGIKGNITANKLATSKIHINNLNRSVDMVLDNDKLLGYANISASYVLNARDFDMEFSLAYYGNYGDRVISNGGGVEWRVGW